MRTKWTNIKLFEQIVENLRKNYELPDILEYSKSAYKEVNVTTWAVDCLGSPSLGVDEGIDLVVYLKGESGDIIPLGEFKTLRRSRESWYSMMRLMTDFQWEWLKFIHNHIEDFKEADE